MEVSAAVFILVARQQIKTTVLVVRRSLVLVKLRMVSGYRRSVRQVRRVPRRLTPPSDEDGLVGFWHHEACPLAA
jgi:hypothetical protein